MEAPEKIYLLPRQGGDYAPYWKTDSQDGFGIEYTRTDAFIEKALAYLNEKFYFNNLHYGIESGLFDSMEEMFEDFKRYMEDEL